MKSFELLIFLLKHSILICLLVIMELIFVNHNVKLECFKSIMNRMKSTSTVHFTWSFITQFFYIFNEFKANATMTDYNIGNIYIYVT